MMLLPHRGVPLTSHHCRGWGGWGTGVSDGMVRVCKGRELVGGLGGMVRGVRDEVVSRERVWGRVVRRVRAAGSIPRKIKSLVCVCDCAVCILSAANTVH